MKIYIFSDTHGSSSKMVDICRASPPDMIIHAGDYVRDTNALAGIAPVTVTPGNGDGISKLPAERVLTLENVRLLITHGHIYNVKNGLERIYLRARELGVQAVIFGHTHIAVCRREGGILLLNPGSLTLPARGGGSCAELTLSDGQASAVLRI